MTLVYNGLCPSRISNSTYFCDFISNYIISIYKIKFKLDMVAFPDWRAVNDIFNVIFFCRENTKSNKDASFNPIFLVLDIIIVPVLEIILYHLYKFVTLLIFSTSGLHFFPVYITTEISVC